MEDRLPLFPVLIVLCCLCYVLALLLFFVLFRCFLLLLVGTAALDELPWSSLDTRRDDVTLWNYHRISNDENVLRAYLYCYSTP